MNEPFLCCIIHFIFYDNYNINIAIIRIIISSNRSVQYYCQNITRKNIYQSMNQILFHCICQHTVTPSS